MTRITQTFRSPVAVLVAILTLALALRIWGIGDWSLWEDEETTLYFSQHPGKAYPSYFPVFFVLLNQVFQVTGVSAIAGRLVATAFGLVSIGLTYEFGRRLASRPAGLIAAALLAVGLGHVYWCQSVRYYTLVLCLELVCLIAFWEGLERPSVPSMLLAHVALALALWTHFSAVLLVPVLVAYVGLTGFWPGRAGGYGWKTWLAFGLPLVAVMALFTWKFLALQRLNLIANTGHPAVGQDVLGILARVTAYFGAPIVLFGTVAALAPRVLPGRNRLLLSLTAFLPVLEIMVIGRMGLAIVTWYYAYVGLSAFAVLTGAGLTALWAAGRRRMAVLSACAAAAYSAVFLAVYFTQAAGDRPRWRDAAAFLDRAAGVWAGADHNPEVYASVPGVVAYYLGVPPQETMGHPLVKPWPNTLPAGDPAADQWFVIEARTVPSAAAPWLDEHCALEARFEAYTGPFDRTLLVYHRRGGLMQARRPACALNSGAVCPETDSAADDNNRR